MNAQGRGNGIENRLQITQQYMLAVNGVDGGVERIALSVENLHRIARTQTQDATGMMRCFRRKLGIGAQRQRWWAVESWRGHGRQMASIRA